MLALFFAFFYIFVTENLHMSKKMRTFAPQSSHWGPRRALTLGARWGERRQELLCRFSGAVSTAAISLPNASSIFALDFQDCLITVEVAKPPRIDPK